MLDEVKQERLDRIKGEYANYDEIISFMRELERDDVQGNDRKALVQEKFPDIAELDIEFLLFYAEGWM